MLSRGRTRTKPNPYPSLPFHILRTIQLLSSIVVAAITSFFLRELARDGYQLPWTFILLLAVSLLTLISLTITITLHFLHGLNPLLSLILNSALLTLWAVCFGLLTRWASGTLAHICTTADWGTGNGVAICRTYKALFSFSLFGVLATLLAVFLDIRVRRKEAKRGKFSMLGGGAGPEGGESKGGVEMWAESNPNPMAKGKGKKRGGQGYEMLEGQVKYDSDTSYHGAAGQVERKSLENRI